MMQEVPVSFNSTEMLRKNNRHSVFMDIYDHQSTSRQEIAGRLGLSLPTVNQNLNELQEMGLVRKNGVFHSTGGRKADAYEIIEDARIAVGCYLQKDSFRMAAVSLFGEVLFSCCKDVSFANSYAYFQQLGDCLQEFLQEHHIAPEAVLGVNMALEAIVSPNHDRVTYSEVYKCTGLTEQELCRHIPYPCKLYHDSHATAEAELWARKDIHHAVLIILNRYAGGSLIIDGKICEGNDFGCVLEHMCLKPDGPRCYCGKQGCFETYCSAFALERDVGEPLDSFFRGLRQGDARRGELWERFLHYLALGINNIRMIIDCEFIIGGYLLPYMTAEDFSRLQTLVDAECPFGFGKAVISPSHFEAESAAQGAGLPLVEEYLLQI